MPEVTCPSCRKKIHPPERLAGRRVVCPRCEAVLVVPAELAKAVEEAAQTESSPPIEDHPFPPSARLGMLSIGLGLASILIMCLPLIGYLSYVMSSIGLLLGLGGLYRSRTDSEPLPPQAVGGGVGIWSGFGTHSRDYPLAGVAACLIALLLSMLPSLLRMLSESQT
jgi:hypothetical protein